MAPDDSDLDDAAAAEYAGKVFALVDRWHAETTQSGIPDVEPGSPLAGDDAGLGYLQLSHFAGPRAPAPWIIFTRSGC